MCRSIKVLRRAGETVTEEELDAAALQFVRKISGCRKPSKINQAAFDRGVGMGRPTARKRDRRR